VDYLNFEIRVSSAADGDYTVSVRSDAGETTGTMRFPFDSIALENRLQALQIALLRSGGPARRRAETPESKRVDEFGRELWQALFSSDVQANFAVAREKAKASDRGVRLKLQMEPPELAALPWEYLYDGQRRDYLALSMTTPIVRYIPVGHPIEPLVVNPPLRMLGMVVSPDDLDALDVDREKQRLEEAVAELKANGIVELHWIEGRSWRDLEEALWEGPWHVFHFIGHGGYDEGAHQGVVLFAGGDGRSQRTSANDLGLILGDHEPLRLAVLNSCESARGDQADVFSSTGAVLVSKGTPAVVAMQYEITDRAAIEFSRTFYRAIARGLPADAAVGAARKAIALTLPNTLEWGTPVLFMRAMDGVLFRLPERAAAAVEAAAKEAAAKQAAEAERLAAEEQARKAAQEQEQVAAQERERLAAEAATRQAAEEQERLAADAAAREVAAREAAGREATARQAAAEAQARQQADAQAQARQQAEAQARAAAEAQARQQAEAQRAAAVVAKPRGRSRGAWIIGGAIVAILLLGLVGQALSELDGGFTPDPPFTPEIPLAAAITVGIDPIIAGQVLPVAGSGFAPGEEILISVNDLFLGSAFAEPDGSFVVHFQLPPDRFGTGTLFAEGQTSGRTASVFVTVFQP
jgi:CHAT domain-containing protein